MLLFGLASGSAAAAQRASVPVSAYTLAAQPTAAANELSDPDADARGFTRLRETVAYQPWEHYDPFTGNLLLSFTDAVLPGPAGFDLRIQRTYNSKIFNNLALLTLNEDSWAGVGWTLQLGRILLGNGFAAVDMPDGSRHRMYNAGNGEWITKSFWRYQPNASPPILKLTNGVTYEFGHWGPLAEGYSTRYVTRMTDAHGNRIDIAYKSDPLDAIDRITQYITSTRTRTVTFGTAGTTKHLSWMKVTAGTWSQTWNYSHDNLSNGFSLLRSAQPPEGPAWGFAYHRNVNAVQLELKSVTTPQGGTVNYQFDTHVYSYCWNDLLVHYFQFINSRGLVSRSVGGRDVAPGTWTYQYAQGNNSDQTVVSGPCGKTVYTFWGIVPISNFCPLDPYAQPYRVGTMLSKQTFDGNTEVRSDSYTWGRSAQLSGDLDYYGPWSAWGVYTPLIDTRQIWLGGHSYFTRYDYNAGNYNDYGRPWKISEFDDIRRTTAYTFKYGFTPYIVDRIGTETISFLTGWFTKSYTYDLGSGFKKSDNIFGISTTYIADSSGNVMSATDAGSHKTSFTYDWGVVKNTQTPQYTITRGINPSGTVAWDRRTSNTRTDYSYDDLNRLTRVEPPLGNDIVTSYANDGISVTTTRGFSSVTTQFDGFGRSSASNNSVSVRTDTSYDACGRRTYQSYPYETVNIGTSFQFDVLGRPTRKTNGDGTVVRYAHNGIDTTITDEQGRVTRQDWTGYGEPTDALLTAVTDANGKVTSYEYNGLGQVTKVTHPAGLPRSWTYNMQGLLVSETHPEAGTISYTHFPEGHVETRTDAEFGRTTFSYDANHRLTLVDRPSGALHDVELHYNELDNRTFMANGYVQSIFTYDDASRMRTRTDQMDGRSFLTEYGYDDNDNVDWMRYASGRLINYAYDTENRLDRVDDTTGGVARARGFSHHPSGSPNWFTLGNAQQHAFTYDDRYRVRYLNAGTPLGLEYEYFPVGNVKRIWENSRTGKDQAFAYDAVDRLWTANGFWGAASYLYTNTGNRYRKTLNGATTNTWYDTGNRLYSAVGAEADSLEYDRNGNLTLSGFGTRAYSYTPSNMMETAMVGGATTTYRYDGDEQRKQRLSGGQTRYFIHGLGGQLLGEYAPTDLACGGGVEPLREYVYAGTRPLGLVEYLQDLRLSGGTTLLEHGGAFTLTVTLTTRNGCVLGAPVSVHFATANGSAQAGSDYTPQSGTLTFPAGSLSGATQQITVPVLDDSLLEADETFTLSLSNPVNAEFTPPTTLTLTIIDNDAEVSLTAAAASVDESVGTHAAPARIVTGNGRALVRAVSVNYTSVDGTALAGQDYTAVAGTLTFGVGTANGATQNIVVAILDDLVPEDAESFAVQISNPVNATLGSPTQQIIAIALNDGFIFQDGFESGNTSAWSATVP